MRTGNQTIKRLARRLANHRHGTYKLPRHGFGAGPRASSRRFKLENLQTQGISLPRLGLGTFRMQGDVCRAAVESALALGYRHIDTAEMYGNEDAIGAAIASSRVARKDLHITTKVWNENLAPEAMRRAFETSLKKMRL